MNPNKKPPQNQEQESERETQKRPKPSDSESPSVKEGDRGPHVDRVGMPTTDVEGEKTDDERTKRGERD